MTKKPSHLTFPRRLRPLPAAAAAAAAPQRAPAAAAAAAAHLVSRAAAAAGVPGRVRLRAGRGAADLQGPGVQEVRGEGDLLRAGAQQVCLIQALLKEVL